MEKFKVSFEANNQQLKALGTKHASDTYADIEATFVLGEKWTDMDSVSAVWWNDFTRIATVLDSQGKCIVPHEVLTRKGCVRVNLVGSIVEGDELITRLTSYSAEAVQVNEKIKLTGSETSEVTPSQYEQFVANVKSDADRAEAGATASEQSAQSASESATASANSASDSAQSAIASAQSAQNASESAISAESAKDDAEDARDEILGMRATAETLEAGSDATASYSDGLLTLGIPRGDRGEQGIQGETGATPNLTIGTVETLAPTEDATATITGTAEEPVLNLGIPKGDTGEVSLEDLEALLPTDTASGDIASITDGQNVVPVKSLKVTLEPIQDLHGYDKPWSGGAGKNKLPISCDTETKGGVTYTVYKNSSGAVTRIHAEGTSTSAHSFSVVQGRSASNPFTIKAGSYWFKGLSGVAGSFDFNIRKTGATTDTVQITSKVPLVLEEDTDFQSCYMYVYRGGIAINADIYPMAWLQSEASDDFAPYSNLCPISGHTECVTEVSGVNVWDEEWEFGSLNAQGQPIANRWRLRSKNFIPIAPNTQYYACFDGVYTTGTWFSIWYYDVNKNYISGNAPNKNSAFTTPSNARYMKFNTSDSWNGATYTSGISINYPSTDHDYHAYQGTTYTTTLGRTVYGGTLDVVSGELVVDRAMVDLGTLNWGYSGGFFRITNLTNLKRPINNSTATSALCTAYNALSWNAISRTDSGSFAISAGSDNPIFCNTNYTDATAFKESVSGVMLCYELATPQTYQLDPVQVACLLGTNNVWSDGNVTLVYSADIQKYIEKKLNGNSTTLTMSRPMVQTETE